MTPKFITLIKLFWQYPQTYKILLQHDVSNMLILNPFRYTDLCLSPEISSAATAAASAKMHFILTQKHFTLFTIVQWNKSLQFCLIEKQKQ